MRRRQFLGVLGGAAVAWPFAVHAQQPQMPVIGFLSGRSPHDSRTTVAAFYRGLKEIGFSETQVEIDFRWALGHYDQLPALAADLVRRKPSAIVATGGGIMSAQAAKASTVAIPVIFVAGTDPVASGLVASLNKPGGNVTGVSFLIGALMAKRIEMLHELVPTAAAIGVLVNPNFPETDTQVRDAQTAAQTLGKQLVVVHAGTDGELGTAFALLVQQRAGALVVAADPFLNSRAEQLATLAARHAIAAMHTGREYALAGGLMSYGTSINDAHRQAGIYAGRILKGDKAADLPVMQSVKLELVINLKTAKSLGLSMPQTLLARADEVIE